MAGLNQKQSTLRRMVYTLFIGTRNGSNRGILFIDTYCSHKDVTDATGGCERMPDLKKSFCFDTVIRVTIEQNYVHKTGLADKLLWYQMNDVRNSSVINLNLECKFGFSH